MFTNPKLKAIQQLAAAHGDTGGLLNRIDENRKLLKLLCQQVPHFLQSHPGVEGWIKGNDAWFDSLRSILELPTPPALEGQNDPRDWPRPPAPALAEEPRRQPYGAADFDASALARHVHAHRHERLYERLLTVFKSAAADQGYELLTHDAPDEIPHLAKHRIGQCVLQAKWAFSVAWDSAVHVEKWSRAAASTGEDVKWTEDLLAALETVGVVPRRMATVPHTSSVAALGRVAAASGRLAANGIARADPAVNRSA